MELKRLAENVLVGVMVNLMVGSALISERPDFTIPPISSMSFDVELKAKIEMEERNMDQNR
ncbi:hypothetical protein GCM10007160_15370 [Litchfieldella qijiaojingensis]|uniref:Uncharacterized protein n=1 Tax=Litchfieldella qijiaojingensis TaxID=980347 RepID=A0ABQ2YLZ9_9GAMM|nr:hypothetical protein [Halomonas qijiaojingensis]GGX88793.1 hypothetical protein GCM10007160_15370 [Halomonas qijiaojingensis]